MGRLMLSRLIIRYVFQRSLNKGGRYANPVHFSLCCQSPCSLRGSGGRGELNKVQWDIEYIGFKSIEDPVSQEQDSRVYYLMHTLSFYTLLA